MSTSTNDLLNADVMQYQTDTVTLVQKIVLFDPLYFENSNTDQVISIKVSKIWRVCFAGHEGP